MKKERMIELVKKYPYIVAWERLMRAYQYYMESQLELASEDNAPETAIYKDSGDKWHLFSDISNISVKQEIEMTVAKMLENQNG